MADKFEKDDLVLCIDIHRFTDSRWNYPELLDQYTVQEVLCDGGIRLNEVNNDLNDFLLANAGMDGLTAFFPWHFIKIEKLEESRDSKDRRLPQEKKQLWEDGKISTMEVNEACVHFIYQENPAADIRPKKNCCEYINPEC